MPDSFRRNALAEVDKVVYAVQLLLLVLQTPQRQLVPFTFQQYSSTTNS